jgi:hypothetical protein
MPGVAAIALASAAPSSTSIAFSQVGRQKPGIDVR